MTRQKSLTLAAVAVSVAATSGCAAIHRRLSFLHFGHHAPQFQPLPGVVKTAQAQTSADTAVDGYYDEAAKAIERKDYASALDLLQAARLHKANDVRVLNAFGVVYDKLGRFDLSTRYYSQARALDPGSAIIANNMAYSLAMQERAAVEERPVLTALAVEPDQTYRVAEGFTAASAQAPADLKVAAPLVADAEPAPAPAAPPRRAADPLALAQTTNPLLQRISFRPVAPLPTVDLTGGLPAAPPPASAPRRPISPLSISQAPNPLLQRLSASVNEILSPLRMDPLVFWSAPPAPPATAAAYQPPVRQVTYVTAPPAQPKMGRIVAIAPGVMRLELGSEPAPTVFLAPRGPILSGHPLMIVDATGRPNGALKLRDTLAGRGWATEVATAAPLQAHTVIRYDRDNLPVAQGLARSLPMKVELAACDDGCSGVRLIIGADAVNWKPAPHHAADRRKSGRA